MENLTLEQAVENHRKLWHEIFNIIKYEGYNYNIYSIRPDLEIKISAFHRTFPDQKPPWGICWLCEYANKKREIVDVNACSYCPLTKMEDVKEKGCLKGLYYEYVNAVADSDYDKAASIAEQIANLPVVNTGGNDAEQL